MTVNLIIKTLSTALITAALLSGCTRRAETLHWTKIDSQSRASLRGVSAVSENTVWASGTGGSVMRSLDGGSHWQHFNIPDGAALDFRDVQAFDQNTAIIMSAGNGEQSRLFKTEDGGQHWRLLYTNTYPEGFYNGMAFWNRQQGILYSDAVANRFLVLRTQDGGESWQEVGRETMPESLPGEHAYAASGTGITVTEGGHVWFASGGPVARVYHSDDYGIHWTVATTPVISNSETSGIFSLAFHNAKQGVVVGGDYKHEKDPYPNVAITQDGGLHWALAENFPSGLCNAVLYLERNLLLTVNSYSTHYSTDGGRHWHLLSDSGYYAVSHAQHTAWAVGKEGKMGRLRLDPLY